MRILAAKIVISVAWFYWAATTSVFAGSVRELRVASEYLVTLNELIVEASEIVVATSQYDEIAYGLIDGDVTEDYAGRQLTLISANVR
jgi:hypothetical protein